MSRSLLTRLGAWPSLLALLLTAAPASAQTDYFWNAPTGGTGTWDTTTQNWATVASGPVDYIWLNNGSERANFGDTAGTVTLAEAITAYGLNFTTTGYTIGGSTLTLAGTGGPISVGTGTGTINSALAGTAGMTKSGAGTLVLGTASTYTGTTTVSAGTLQAGANNVFSSGAFSLANVAGVLLDLNNTSQTIGSLAGGGTTGGNVATGTTGSLTVGNNASTTYSGLFTGSGTITKVGSGTLTLRGNSTWTGPLNILGGVVSIDALGRLNSAASATGTVTLDGGTLQHTGTGAGSTFLAPTRGIAIGANGGTIDITTTTGGIGIYRGTITGPGNTLTKIGAGEFRVDTAATAGYTFGKLVVNQGLYRVGGTGTETGFGAAPASFLADAITLNGGAIGTSLNLTLNANRGVTLGSAGGTFDMSSAPLTVPGIISGSGSLTRTGTQLLTLSGANTYSGATNINAGELRAGAANTFSPNSAVNVASGAILGLANFNQTIASLAGAGNVVLGTGTLTTGGDNTSTTHSGVISGASGVLIKQGTGTQILTGANTFAGGLTISGGTVQVGTGGTTGSLAAALPITNDGALVVNKSNNLALNGAISGTGTVTKQGDGILTLGGTNSYTGGTTVSAGTLRTGVANALPTGGAIVLNGGTLSTGATTGFDQTPGALDLDASSTIALGTGSHILNFSGLVASPTGILTITGWTGPAFGQGTDGRIVFASDANFTQPFLDSVQFVGFPQGASLISSGGQFELTPVPEPGTVLALGAAGLGLGGLVRRRLRRRDVALAA